MDEILYSALVSFTTLLIFADTELISAARCVRVDEDELNDNCANTSEDPAGTTTV
jgi:hypothetical protein